MASNKQIAKPWQGMTNSKQTWEGVKNCQLCHEEKYYHECTHEWTRKIDNLLEEYRYRSDDINFRRAIRAMRDVIDLLSSNQK